VENTGRFGRVMRAAVRTRAGDTEDVGQHCDASIDFLAPRMVCFCAHCAGGTEDLATAQTAKPHHTLTKYAVKAGCARTPQATAA
jgi:cyclopropane fatty-acyl-phospholipid synthase-like methyltransferase